MYIKIKSILEYLLLIVIATETYNNSGQHLVLNNKSNIWYDVQIILKI